MAKICDRCESRNVHRTYSEKTEGRQFDLCKPCNEELEVFLFPPKEEKKPKPRKGS